MLQNYLAKFKAAEAILIIVISICVLQIGILWIPEGIVYRVLEYISSDGLLVLLSLGMYLKTPYRKVIEKSGWTAIFLWHMICWIYNFAIQIVFVDTTIVATSITSAVVISAICYAFRYVLRWKISSTGMESDTFYVIIGKPLNSEQLALAAKTGLGGSFSITDGKSLWLYSNISNQYEEINLPSGYCNGRMVKRLCRTTETLYNEVRDPIGTPYSLMHNCDEINLMSKRWGK